MDQKKYYSGLDAIETTAESKAAQNKEFQEDPFEAAVSGNISASRRDFLKIMGFSVGTAATLAACTKTPVKYALPYVDKPHEIIPTIPNFYATTYFDGEQYESLLVKTREGRPIKIEGNSSSPVTRGGTSARSQASVLSLYDTNRLKQPQVNKKATTWSAIDSQLGNELKNASSIRIITPTIISPSTQRLFDEFSEAFPKAKFITYDAMSYSGLLEANEKTFGKRAIPAYRFDKANIIVSFNADFMGTWLSPVEFSAQWATTRDFRDDNKRMSRHYQFETIMSLTGSNADTRIPMKPSHEGAFILKLHSLITGRGSGGMEAPGNMLAAVAAELQANRGKSIVVSGSNDPNVQMLVNEINSVLGNYGTTIDLANHCNLRKGVDSEMNTFVQELESGQVGAVIFYDVNPVYTHPLGKKLAAAIKNVRVSVFYGTSLNETGALCGYQLPEPHYLESWGDAEPYRGQFSIQQPTINPLFDSRPFQASLLTWLGDKRPYHDYIKDNWKNGPLKGQKDSEDAWKTFVHDGVYATNAVMIAAPKAEEAKDAPADKADNKAEDKANAPVMVGGQPKLMEEPVAAAASKVQSAYDGKLGKLELVVYEKVGIGAGKDGHNPLIQEFPDPISRVTWDNYVCIPQFLAEKEGIKNEDLVEVSANGHSVTLPALIQPGQQRETIAIAAGYGRTETGPANKDVGGNAFPFATVIDGNVMPFTSNVKISKAGGSYKLASVQRQPTAMGRNVIRETTVDRYDKDVAEYQKEREHLLHHLVSLYGPKDAKGHRWMMAIDLNKCNGCGACVVACNVENNIAVVGRDEVRRGREMHWIRIDRYYSAPNVKSADTIEEVAEEPEVVFQPMLCQHCGDAPCENVCPVLATVHSSEGMNQQAYNRCFGTRYCANNCPYKVRRFNWLDYTNGDNFKFNPGVEGDGLARFALNPDVSIRARGVMEKCSFCAQRIQNGKLQAKKEGRLLTDEDVKPACASACPSGCITFGDVNDPTSAIAALMPKNAPYEFEPARPVNRRAYHVIEEVKTRPSISYLMKVRNKAESKMEKTAEKA